MAACHRQRSTAFAQRFLAFSAQGGAAPTVGNAVAKCDGRLSGNRRPRRVSSILLDACIGLRYQGIKQLEVVVELDDGTLDRARPGPVYPVDGDEGDQGLGSVLRGDPADNIFRCHLSLHQKASMKCSAELFK